MQPRKWYYVTYQLSRDISNINHHVEFLGGGGGEQPFCCTPCADVRAVLIRQGRVEAFRLLPVFFTWCLFWNWRHRIGQSLCSGRDSLPGTAESCEKKTVRSSFGTGEDEWAHGAHLSPVGRGCLQKVQWPQQSWFYIVQTLIVGPLGWKAELKEGPKLLLWFLLPQNNRQSRKKKGEQEGAGKEARWAWSYVLEEPYQDRLSSTHFYSTFFSNKFAI